MKWVRYRFKANAKDPRPVKWPPLGPFWITGHGEGYATVVAYLPAGQLLTNFWPEACDIDSQEADEIVFTDRFPRPEYWSEK